MVCDRCISAVREQFETLNFRVNNISLGTIEVKPEPSEIELTQIDTALKILGFELIDKEKDKLIERIRNIIIEAIHHSDEKPPANFTEVLSDQLHRDYSYLSRLFSECENTTIEKFIIQQKIEKVKEFLQYGELNLNEIAWKMGYSSSAHLSNQFKVITGQSPSHFKAHKVQVRTSLDKL